MPHSKRESHIENYRLVRASVDIPDRLHNFYKVWASHENISLKELILRSLVFYVEAVMDNRGEQENINTKTKFRKIGKHEWDEMGALRYAGLSQTDFLNMLSDFLEEKNKNFGKNYRVKFPPFRK